MHIKIKVTNIEKDGYYNLRVKKVDAKGNLLKSNAIKFKIVNGVEKTVETGYADLISAKEINAQNVNVPDVYEITETETINGYAKLKNPIKVTVNKYDNGEKFIVSSIKVESNNTSISVGNGEVKTLKNLQLINGATVDVQVDLQTENLILLSVPNDKLTGKYNIEIFKYTNKDGSQEPVSGICFDLLKYGTTYFQRRITNAYGKCGVTDIPITEEGTQKFVISEVKTSDNKYINLNEDITVNI